MRTQSFYNTNATPASELAERKQKASGQETGVLTLFTAFGGVKASASEVLAAGIERGYFHQATPITSIRRAISNLCQRQKLVKLSETRKGPMGSNEHLFTLKQ